MDADKKPTSEELDRQLLLEEESEKQARANIELIHAKKLELGYAISSNDSEPTTSSASSLLDSFMFKLRAGEGDILYDAGENFKGFEAGPEKICFIGAPPGAGKTALAMQYVFAAVKHEANLKAYIANAEMSFPVLLRRELTRRSGVDANSIRFATLTQDELKRVEVAARDLEPFLPQIEVVNGPYNLISLERLKNAAPGLLVVDYLQKFAVGDDARTATNAVVTCLRELALMGWGVIALSATTRLSGYGHDSTKLSLASFKESGEIEFNGDSCYLIRTDLEAIGMSPGQSRVQLDCVKNRHGEHYSLPMVFDKPRMSFELMPDVSKLKSGGTPSRSGAYF